MNLLFYSREDDPNKKRLEDAVHEVIPRTRIEPYASLGEFRKRLQTPVEPDSIAVISAADRAELRQIQLLRRLLTEIYVVLVIPDRKKSTIRLAHVLLPRFLSLKESDFADLKQVLNKMYVNSQNSRVGDNSRNL